MFTKLFLLAMIVCLAVAASDFDGCLFDGRVYQAGDVITIPKCLAQMTCLGQNNYGDMKQLYMRCLFDGRVYQAGDVITIPNCLAQMTCLGQNNYGDLKQLYGICP
ncbi:uncharacterized protein LOC106011433 [Aplysia californica]|uniref:Uncharacterized protein LOC106011433 n=1 Tax=Aplysia californica TaxID=6500 RepID=A0ABM1VRE1_APLCA|nr:uncharacterized protein LOC106011433 [Aplysia californica]